MPKSGARIYNLFPRLAGSMSGWKTHFERAASMGFDWIYINPIHYPGFSGSLYAPKDYYRINPMFLNDNSSIPPMKQLEQMLSDAHSLGLKVMMDLVVNHTAKDHAFVREKPHWYKHKENGDILSPGAWDNGQWIEWGDLAEIDNETDTDREGLWNYWKELVVYYLQAGFDGFRADAAYKIPQALWKSLIKAGKKTKPGAEFFAESLGCSLEDTVKLAEAGFDYTFNSSKWWNFKDSWLLEQYEQTRKIAASVSFPESHDTLRIADECKNFLPGIMQKILFSALFSSGWMIVSGTEYGFQKKTDVVHMQPTDWEKPTFDLTGFLREVNHLKTSRPLFQNESDNKVIPCPISEELLVMEKTYGKEKVWIFLETGWKSPVTIQLSAIPELAKKANALKALEIPGFENRFSNGVLTLPAAGAALFTL